MSAAPNIPKKQYTREEYLALEEKASERHEYHDGEMLAMSGGSKRHSVLGGNAYALLKQISRKKGCFTFNNDMKVELAAYNNFVYPDTSIVCGEHIDFDDGKTYINNPSLILEVLSDSTEAYDRGAKFKKYRSLASFKEYVLVSQHEKRIEVFSKKEENVWQMAFYEAGDQVKLPNLDLVFLLDDLYEDLPS